MKSILFSFLFLTSLVSQSQTIDTLNYICPIKYNIDSITTLSCGYESYESNIYLSNSVQIPDSSLLQERNQSYKQTFYLSYVSDSIIGLHSELYVRSFHGYSQFSRNSNIQPGNELKLYLSNNSMITLVAERAGCKGIEVCINYCHNTIYSHYKLSESNRKLLANNSITQIVQNHGSGQYLILDPTLDFKTTFIKKLKTK